jgi:tRNA (cytidine/uridine-2'-O-)-methyltransferase
MRRRSSKTGGEFLWAIVRSPKASHRFFQQPHDHEFAMLSVYEDWAECAACFKDRRMFPVSTRGTQRYDRIDYVKGDVFLFGPEARGLPSALLGSFAEERRIRLPMRPESRSLNLSNTVAVVVYEAWRQVGFGNGM